jgi:hypothetical protein
MKVVEFIWNKIGSFRRFDPFAIAFCYPINDEPFILKGGARDIEDRLEKSKTPVFVNIVFYIRHGKYSRWKFYGLDNKLQLFVSQTYLLNLKSNKEMYEYPTGFEITIRNKLKSESLIKTYRKLPKAFPRVVKEYLFSL